jgi:RNA polymerase sigma-70 factor, ECF subfamily
MLFMAASKCEILKIRTSGCKKSQSSSDYILRRAAKGREMATVQWDQIVEQYSLIVWRTVTRLVPERADAADCFQRTFIAAWELSQKQSIRHWPALLRRLATARALERRRELARNRVRHCEMPENGVIDRRASDPANDAEATELEGRLRIALADIAPREAEVFCLACLEGLTYRDIGLQLDLTENHVGVLLNRARSQLRSRLIGLVLNPHSPESEDLR